jgi:hypothetical protein
LFGCGEGRDDLIDAVDQIDSPVMVNSVSQVNLVLIN